MGDTIIRQQLSNYSSIIHAGKPLFEHPAIADFADKLPSFDCLLPIGRVELGDRSSPRQIVWKVPGSGTVVPFADLNEDEKVRVRRQVDAAIRVLQTEAQRQGAAGRELSQVIRKIRSPHDDFIFVLGGKPVVTGWGLVQDGPEPTMRTAAFKDEPVSEKVQAPQFAPGPPAGVPPKVGIREPETEPGEGSGGGTPLPPRREAISPPPTGGSRWWICALLVLLTALIFGALAYYFYDRFRTCEKQYLTCVERSKRLQEELKQLKKTLSGQEASVRECGRKDKEIERLGKELQKCRELAEKRENDLKDTAKKLDACMTKCRTPIVPGAPDSGTPQEINVIWYWDETTGHWRSMRVDDPKIKTIYGTLPKDLYGLDGKVWVWNETCGCYRPKKLEKRTPAPVSSPMGPAKPRGPVLIRDRLGSPGMKISRLAVFEVDPPDSSARWSISIDPSSPQVVRNHPQNFIKFMEPQEGLTSVGSKVVVGWISTSPFRAVIKAIQSSGKSTSYNVVVSD